MNSQRYRFGICLGILVMSIYGILWFNRLELPQTKSVSATPITVISNLLGNDMST